MPRLAFVTSTAGIQKRRDNVASCFSTVERQKGRSRCKTYSSRDSHVVTHRSTNLPFNCLCMAERTGCPVFS
ncbi:hypothetical protein KCU91_g16595, partial [Aureobasidium melanogenum]